MWLIVAIVIIGLIIAGSISGNSETIKKAKEQEQFAALANDRGRAYAQYLRRTSNTGRIRSMTDIELLDFVTGNIRSYRKDCHDRDSVGALILFGGCVLSMFIVASGEWSWIAFFFLCGLSLGGAYLFTESQNKTILKKYQDLDLEIERLEVK